MKVTTLARLGAKHALNSVAESLYLKNICDISRPTTVYGILTKRCNSRCRYCDFWRLDKQEYEDEMDIDQWQRALKSLKDFIGCYFVEFSGGEPLVKRGLLDLLKFCRQNGIQFGITTNGLALNERFVQEYVACHPFNINISVDAAVAEVHDYLRGVPGSLEKIERGIRLLSQESKSQGIHFPIIVKPTVNAKNLHLLPELVTWAQDVGATAVNFQPMDRWTTETNEELWIEKEQFPQLQAVVDRLKEMKKQGAPILTSDLLLDLWAAHFRDEKAPPEALPCLVGLRNVFIRPNGDVEVCWTFPPIGNVRTQSMKEIWRSPEARKIRKASVACQQLCLFTCLSHKTIMDKARLALKLLRRK